YYGSNKQKSLYLWVPLTRPEYESLEAALRKREKAVSVPQYLQSVYNKEVKELLKPAGSYENLDAIFEQKKDGEVLEALKLKMRARVEEFLSQTKPA
ncbi:MAG TPA: hypothetical protein VIS74_02995, partial [Chthoniobacterales bacterium]